MSDCVSGRSKVPPLLRPGFAVRQRLDDRVDNAPVVAVWAAAGFGKTQLLVHWHHQAVRRGNRVGWLSLPAAVSEPALVAALSALVSPDLALSSLDAIVARLGEQPRSLFIDNCTDATPLLAELADRLPAGCRVTLAGRSLPRLPAPVVRIDMADLAFDEVESLAVLRTRLPQIAIDRQSLVAQLCDGWPLGFNLAETVLGPGTPADDADLAAVARNLSTLGDDLLAGDLDVATKTALAEVSLVEALTLPVALAVTGRGDIAATIELGHARGILVADDEDMTLRPARFAAALLERWRCAVAPDRLTAVHAAAAAWFADHARPLDAIHHALAAGDIERAAMLLQANLLYMVGGGDFDRALAWVSMIPDARIMIDDTLRFSVALVHVVAGERKTAARYLTPGTAAEQLLFRTLLANFADDPDTGAFLLEQIADPAAIPPALVPLYANMTRWIDYSRGRFDRLDAVEPVADPSELSFSNCFKLFREAQRHLALGRASAAVALLDEPLNVAERQLGRDSFPATLLSLPLAAAWAQLGDGGRAAAVLADRALTRVGQLAVDALALSMTTQARLAFAHGKVAEGEAVIDHFLSIATERGLVRLEAMCVAERVRNRGVMLGPAALGESTAILGRIAADAPRFAINDRWIRLPALLGAAHAARHGASPEQALALLDEAEDIATALDQHMALAEIAMVRAALPCVGTVEAIPSLAIMHDDAMALSRQLGLPLPPTLTIAPPLDRPTAASSVVIITSATTTVALTAREEDVLACLMLSQSNKSIARSLDLSHETVKWHIANLFRKLAVRDRRALVRRSRELDLLAHHRLIEAAQ